MNVTKLRVAGLSAGGREKSVETIENAYIHFMAAKPMDAYLGTTVNVPHHLLDHYYQTRRFSCCQQYCVILLLTAAFTFLLLNGFPGLKTMK